MYGVLSNAILSRESKKVGFYVLNLAFGIAQK